MNKNILLEGKNKDEQILLSKILDKAEETNRRNKITNTDFLDEYEQVLAKELLQKIKFKNYILYGGYENAERKVIVFYPEKLEFIEDNKEKICNNILEIIKIKLPNELNGIYNHKNYLGMIMKLGVKREKVGDIQVRNNGADIIILPEVSKFLSLNLSGLTRLKKAIIEKDSIENLEVVESKTEKYKIIVSSLRLDLIVSELLRKSRNQAKEFIINERVFINHKNETKLTKEVQEEDLITVRGKGRYRISKILGKTRKRKNCFRNRKICIKCKELRKNT